MKTDRPTHNEKNADDELMKTMKHPLSHHPSIVYSNVNPNPLPANFRRKNPRGTKKKNNVHPLLRTADTKLNLVSYLLFSLDPKKPVLDPRR